MREREAWRGRGPWLSGCHPLAGLLASLPSPHPVWFYFGVAGSFLFILIQLVLLIDFAHSWNQRWLGKAEECDSRAWYAGQCHPAGLRAGLGLPEQPEVPEARHPEVITGSLLPGGSQES